MSYYISFCLDLVSRKDLKVGMPGRMLLKKDLSIERKNHISNNNINNNNNNNDNNVNNNNVNNNNNNNDNNKNNNNNDNKLIMII